MDGYIQLHRKLLEWEYADTPNVLATFIHLLIVANHKGKKWRGIELARGQAVVSVVDFAKQVGISRQQMRSVLDKLEVCGTIERKSTNKYTLITICKYDDYQVTKAEVQPLNNHQITIKQPSNNHQITTNKNDNKENNLSLREREKGASAGACEEGQSSMAADEADRSRYLKMLRMDKGWLAHCQIENNMLGVSLESYMIAFWMRQTDEKKWRGYEDFQQHFFHWLKFADNGEVKEDYRKYKEAKAKAEAAEMRRQEQTKAEAEWAEHKKRATAMPEEIRKRLLGE